MIIALLNGELKYNNWDANSMIKTILISGGTGLVGKQLVSLLLSKGYNIHLLTRGHEKTDRSGLRIFKWDVNKGQIDEECISGVDAVIHLAGESIGSKRWTDERKAQILESRTKSIRLIYKVINENKNQVNHVISASAVGFYGSRGDELLVEESLPAKDFLAETCIEWENAADEGTELGLRVVKLRSGIILAAEGGILKQMEKPIKFGLGPILGSGSQWISWIHIQDVLDLYVFALENEQMKGVYNMTAPDPVNNSQLTHAIASALKRSPVFFHVPAGILKLALGEMSILALGSTKVSPAKIIWAGFNFRYPNIESALKEIYRNRS